MSSNRLVLVNDDACSVCARLKHLFEQHQLDAHGGDTTPTNHASLTGELGTAISVSGVTRSEGLAEGRTLEEIERVHISRIVLETNGNRSQAARILNIDRSTLYSKLKRYGLK